MKQEFYRVKGHGLLGYRCEGYKKTQGCHKVLGKLYLMGAVRDTDVTGDCGSRWYQKIPDIAVYFEVKL